MKKFLILAALVIAPAVIAGCSCPSTDVQTVYQPYYAQQVCPPAVQPVAVAPAPKPVAPQPVPVVQQTACPPAQVIAVPAPAYLPPVPVGGQVTYAQPIQVSGANTVQYFNPYIQPRVVR